jgi:hypothetical protein
MQIAKSYRKRQSCKHYSKLPNRHTDDLFLLYRKRESLQTRIFGFENCRIEAVIVLRDALLAGLDALKSHKALTYKVNDHSVFLSRRNFSRFHLFLMAVVLAPL